MAKINMKGVLAVKFTSPTTVTVGSASYLQAAGEAVAYTEADVPPGTEYLVMLNATAPSGKILQVFRVDDIRTA